MARHALRLGKGGWLVATAAVALIGLVVEYHLLATGRAAFRAELSDAPLPTARGSASAAAAEVSLPAFPPLDYYHDLIERPPFLPTRRPIADAPQTAERVVEEVRLNQQWKLVGIVVAPEQTYAVLQERRGGRSVHVSVGMSLEGWTVTAVEAELVRLTSGVQAVELKLHPPEDTAQAPKSQSRRGSVFTPR